MRLGRLGRGIVRESMCGREGGGCGGGCGFGGCGGGGTRNRREGGGGRSWSGSGVVGRSVSDTLFRCWWLEVW